MPTQSRNRTNSDQGGYVVEQIPMTDAQMQEWARAYVELCLDTYIERYGPLPAPPSNKEFQRLWDAIATEYSH